MRRTCTQCRQPLPLGARGDARYCSTRCRVAAHRSRRRHAELPVELLENNRWVRHDERKVPLRPDGRNASSTDPRTWSTFATASKSTAGVGIGFVLNGDGIACLDLDHCISDGVLEDWAAELLEQLPPTYVEVSPSGDGLHVWGRAILPRGRRIELGTGQVECYGNARYLTVTGRRWAKAPSCLGDLSTVLKALHVI